MSPGIYRRIKGKFEEKEVYLKYFFLLFIYDKFVIDVIENHILFAQEVKCMSTEKASTVSCSICIVVQSSM